MRKLSTLLEGISYRRLELIIGLSYKVLIRYDKGEAVSETNLKIITDFINRCETDDLYKRSLFDSEKTLKKSKSTKVQVHGTMTDSLDLVNSINVPTVVDTENPIGYFVPQGQIPVDEFGFPIIEDSPKPIPEHNMNIISSDGIQQQIAALTTILNGVLDQLHNVLENQKQLWEHMKELVEIQPVDELIAINEKIGAIESSLVSTNLFLPANPVLSKEHEISNKTTALGKNPVKPKDVYPTTLPDNIPDVMGASFGPDFYANLRKNTLIDSQVLPNQTFLDDDILNILPS